MRAVPHMWLQPWGVKCIIKHASPYRGELLYIGWDQVQ